MMNFKEHNVNNGVKEPTMPYYPAFKNGDTNSDMTEC